MSSPVIYRRPKKLLILKRVLSSKDPEIYRLGGIIWLQQITAVRDRTPGGTEMLGIDFILSSLIISKPENLERGIRKKKKKERKENAILSQPTFSLLGVSLNDHKPVVLSHFKLPTLCPLFQPPFQSHAHSPVISYSTSTLIWRRSLPEAQEHTMGTGERVLWFLMQAPVGCSHTQLQLYREAQGFLYLSDFSLHHLWSFYVRR